MKFIRAKEFLDTMRLVPEWMSLGGKTDKNSAALKAEFLSLKEEAEQADNERSNLLTNLGFCIVMQIIGLLALGGGFVRINPNDRAHSGVLHLIVSMSLIAVALIVVVGQWIAIERKSAQVKLDDYQEMLYDDLVYLLQPTWKKLDWTTADRDEATKQWFVFLRNKAAEIRGLESKTALPDYPDKLDDEQRLDSLREVLSEHLRILNRFRIVNIDKAALFEMVKPAS